MFIATLLVAPSGAPLDPALVANLRNAWGGLEARWLSPDRAAEFGIGVLPANLWDVWSDLQGMGVDLVVQPEEGRRKKMLLAAHF